MHILNLKLIIIFFINIYLIFMTCSYSRAEWGESFLFDGAGWDYPHIKEGAYIGLYPSMQIDSNGLLHISYFNHYENENFTDLKYATYKDGERKSHRIIDSLEDFNILENSGGYISLSLDSNDLPHIAYCDGANTALKYAHYDEITENWNITTIIPEDVGLYTSLEIDNDDTPHIGYYDATFGDLKYIIYDREENIDENIVDTGGIDGDVGKYCSLGLHFDEINNRTVSHIVYYDEKGGNLKYAFFKEDTWQTEIIEAVGDLDVYATLALDRNGIPHIAYYKKNRFFRVVNALKYAVRDEAIGDTNAWKDEFVIDGFLDFFWLLSGMTDEGSHCMLKLDSQDKAHISYFNSSQGRIQYATFNEEEGRWWNKEIPYDSNSGPFNCLILDPSDNAMIVFYYSIE